MIELRVVSTLDEMHECVELQRVTWGDAFDDIVGSSVLQVSQKVGGFLGGAFTEERLVGFVYSLFGRFDGEISHWSHMLAVHPSARGEGLGRRLKLFQREALLEDDIKTMFWTFDPLVARNAHLNLNRLGATIHAYVPNMYGAETGSPLHGGGETDRFIARWDLESHRTRWALEGETTWKLAAVPEPEDIFGGPDTMGPGDTLPEGDQVYIEVPADVESAAMLDAERVAWRLRVREAFTEYLRRGYVVKSLGRESATSRCFYVLRRHG